MERKGKTLTMSVFARRKKQGKKIVLLTAYDLTSALIASAGGVDAILVGDSVGMVVLGHENTLPVTIEDMVHHCKAVCRAKPGVPVIADMPYGSFHVSAAETVRHGLRLVKEAGVSAVKVEGGRNRAEAIKALLDAEIPVMGHLGLTPQSVNRFGGYRVQGRGKEAAAALLDEARFLEEIGCFAMVLECVPSGVGEKISSRLSIPTIGIGAGPGCDGQVLVIHDMLGLFTGLKPKFVKRYAELGAAAVQAVESYTAEVRDGSFPSTEHEYGDEPTGRRDGTGANVSG
ncbi:MAG: 3-methyl-2-oxobutanoate hydroxymethyltransferase, partial [Candidatus Krumholzibacteria bacterium]|nr:3-methyl-2-oxobutanoate hydroxymethyltransferase [Candidatus Krumholzibacteria bacterium]